MAALPGVMALLSRCLLGERVAPRVLAGIAYAVGRITSSTWLLLFYAIAGSVVTAWLWMTGLKQVPAALAGAFTLALAGVVLATWPEQKRPTDTR